MTVCEKEMFGWGYMDVIKYDQSWLEIDRTILCVLTMREDMRLGLAGPCRAAAHIG